MDYMANVFFSGAKHMTRRETDRQNKKWGRKLKNTRNKMESWQLTKDNTFFYFVELDLLIGNIFREKNEGESSREARNKKLISDQLIGKPDSQIDSCKSACWETNFPS